MIKYYEIIFEGAGVQLLKPVIDNIINIHAVGNVDYEEETFDIHYCFFADEHGGVIKDINEFVKSFKDITCDVMDD